MRRFATALWVWAAVCGLLAGGTSSTHVAKRPGASSTVAVADSPTRHLSSASPTEGGRVAVGPWGAALVGGSAAHGRPLAGDHGSLYVSDGAVLFRVDPRTGRVLARRTDLGARLSQAVISGGALWTDPRIGPCEWSAVVHALDLYTLAPIAIVAINIRGLAKPGASLWRTYRRGSIPKLDPSAPPYSALCRRRHNADCADLVVVPTWDLDRLPGKGSARDRSAQSESVAGVALLARSEIGG